MKLPTNNISTSVCAPCQACSRSLQGGEVNTKSWSTVRYPTVHPQSTLSLCNLRPLKIFITCKLPLQLGQSRMRQWKIVRETCVIRPPWNSQLVTSVLFCNCRLHYGQGTAIFHGHVFFVLT
ncbi:hypothetical protein DPMN_069782 [Dreissena polymorpha]|uniref:Uncharacterized protein n=1 Tax=Dreissena polymorpha TaxID=45954 RepID=A0A9D3Z4U3_DREPO|nr:hypothetical protein DPMN_069782 [Dreissena polymorpha]